MAKTIEEKSKKTIARQVVTPKRRYFVPNHGEVEAKDLTDVEVKLKQANKKVEAGDGNK